MKKPLKSPFLVITIVIVAGWTVYQQVIQPLTTRNQPSSVPLQHISLSTHNTTTVATKHTWQPNPEGRNPFAKPTKRVQKSKRAPAPVYKVSAILYDHKKPLALINGKLMGVGEYIDSYQVVRINHRSVSLTKGTQTKQIHLR